LSDLEAESSCEPTPETPCLFGDFPSSGQTAKKASNAPSSVTRVRSVRLSLSDKLTQSLITSGLVAGITPSLIRQLSGAAIRDAASLPLDGGVAVGPRVDWSYWSAKVTPHP